MNSLNDDCLHQIFQYLSLKDQLAVLLASKGFVYVLCNIWRTKYKKRLELKLRNKMQLELRELNEFIRNVHPYVEHLQLECETIDFISLLRPFHFKNTHTLYISVEGSQLLQYEFVGILSDIFPNIKNFQPAGKFTGAGFTLWKQLEQLTLGSCFAFQLNYLEEILQKLPLHTLILNSFELEQLPLVDDALQNCTLRMLVLNSYELSYFTPQLEHFLNLKELHISDLYATSDLDALHNKLVELRNTHCIEGISTRDITAILPKVINSSLHTRLRRLLLAVDPLAFSEMLPYICLIPTLRELHFYACYIRSEAEFQNLFSVSSHLDEISLEGCMFNYGCYPCLDVTEVVHHRTKPLMLNFYGNKSNNDNKAELRLKGHSDFLKLEGEKKLLKCCRYLVYEFS